MDEERTEVFDNKDSAPCDLGAEIFNVDYAFRAETGGVEGEGGFVGDGGAVATFDDTEAVRRVEGKTGECGVESRSAAGDWDGDFGGELGDGFAWVRVSE